MVVVLANNGAVSQLLNLFEEEKVMNYSVVDEYIDINEDKLVGFLQEILRIPSVTGQEGEIQDFIEKKLKDMSFTVDKFEPTLSELKTHPAFVEVNQDYKNRPNVVGTLKGKGNGKSLLFNGHVDVIPEGPAENWKHGCWSGDLEDGKIYGRGASDMKSGVAAMTMAIDVIRNCNLNLDGDLITEYVMDEELSGNGTLACVMKGYKADAGICCETSSMCVQPGSIGRIWFTIKIKGKSAGIQSRYEGVNAIDLGYLIKGYVEDYEKIRIENNSHELYPNKISAMPCMIGMFESGSFNSAFPDSCVLKGSLASLPNEKSSEVKKAFADYIISRSAENEFMKTNPPEVIYEGYFADPSEISKDSPIVKCLSKNFTEVMAEEPIISGREGAADIRHLNTYGNTPTVIFGPGRTDEMHANNEWVLKEDYLNSIKILAHTILEWCGCSEI